jgi:hypothetical protein
MEVLDQLYLGQLLSAIIYFHCDKSFQGTDRNFVIRTEALRPIKELGWGNRFI